MGPARFWGRGRSRMERGRDGAGFMDDIAVLIPCLNERQAIASVVRDVTAALPGAAVYVYDNGSTDGSDELARAAGAVVRREPSRGKGNVVRRMFREVDARCYLMLDGDGTYPAGAAPEMARLVLEEGADMVVGDRLSSTYFQENKRPFHNFGNRLVRAAVNGLFHGGVRDVMTGCRAFSFQFAKSFPVLSPGFEIETEMTVHALDKRMRVENVVIDYRDRPAGSLSKLDTYSDGIRVLFTILRLFWTYRPMRFFGAAALLLAAAWLSLLVLAPCLPAFVADGCATAALASLSCGLLLDGLHRKDLRDFEFKLQQIHSRDARCV